MKLIQLTTLSNNPQTNRIWVNPAQIVAVVNEPHDGSIATVVILTGERTFIVNEPAVEIENMVVQANAQ